ncbi:hypothetical protein [Sediminibacterium salmoneum]|uniref:hypothetical protein n=1 Tax=Sediminibacterium salmoneum TaxID=426421 RepID=UPI00047C762A|nr:hypothetical protein [Sediminibacterium salmoneum]
MFSTILSSYLGGQYTNEQSNDTFSLIVEYKLYLIIPSNLLVILKWHNQKAAENEFYTSNYTFLKSTMPIYVLEHIEENISSYVKNVLLKLPENKNETEESIINLLNNQFLNDDLKADFLHVQRHKIEFISSIQELEDLELAISFNKIQPTWKNVVEYYSRLEENAEINDILIDYFNDELNYKSLAKDELSISDGKNEELVKEFSMKLIYCNSLSLLAYSNILQSISYRYDSFQFDKLDKQKIEWLIENEFIILNQSNFDGIKKIDNHLSIRLLEVYEKEFIDKLTDFVLDTNDWHFLLNSKSFSPEGKIIVIQHIDESIIINNVRIADIICYLLPNDKFIPLSFDVLNAMFKSNDSVQKRIELLNFHFDSLTEDQLKRLIEELGEDYARMFVKQKKPTIANTPFNKRLVENLKKRNMISSFTIIMEKNEIKVVARYNEE